MKEKLVKIFQEYVNNIDLIKNKKKYSYYFDYINNYINVEFNEEKGF